MVRGPRNFANDAGLEAVLLLSVRGETGVRWTSPMESSVAAQLRSRVITTEGRLAFPAEELIAAGCNISRWNKSVEAGVVQRVDMGGKEYYLYPLDTMAADNNPLLTTLEQWANPEWHQRHAEEIKAQAQR